jgi:uncharacterized protein
MVKKIKDIASKKAKKTNDGLLNLINTAAQKRDVTNPFASFYQADALLSPAQCENIYISSWIAKKIIEIPMEYIFKNGFTFKIEDSEELTTRVIQLSENLGILDKVKLCEMYKRVYGGAVLFVKNPHQDLMKEFDATACKVAPNSIEFVPMDLTYLAVTPHIDIVSGKYFEPKTISMAGLTAEASNCVIFRGIQVPKRRMPQFRYIGMSVFQNIFQAMIMDDYISKGIANMVWRNNRWYYKIDGLSEMAKEGNEALALTRLAMVEDSMNILSAGIVDKNDEVQLISQSFSALPEIDRRSLERLSAASNIPATVLLGKSPDGMNATGDGDLENFYSYIEAEQCKIVPLMKQIFNVLICMLTGKEVKFTFEFNKPNQISPSRQMDIDAKVLDNVQKMDGLGVPEDVIKDYMVKYGLLTPAQSEDIKEFEKDTDKVEEEYFKENKEQEEKDE